MSAPEYELSDRYQRTAGTVLLTGIQALARLPIEQLRRDRATGLHTAAFVSGYPGSPLGGFDLEMQRALALVDDLPIVHQPAVNEELGATAVMGSQLAAVRPDAKYDGVVGVWYGKAPGLDRACDALRHAVFAGTHPSGGAVALVGDDPACKSSTMPSSSDATLVDLHMPIFYPGTIGECLELGLHAIAISRATGLWASLKIVTPVADGSGTVEIPVLGTAPTVPIQEVDGRPWQCEPSAQFLGPRMLEVEREFREIRLPLARRYGALNGLNRVTANPPDAWIGVVATGYTYYETLDALRRLGLRTTAEIEAAGIRLLHLRMPVPFDPDIVRSFSPGLEQILVVEEKNPTLEWLVKDALYGSPHAPPVHGKTGPGGEPLFRSWGMLDADAILAPLRSVLQDRLAERLAPLPRPERERIPLTVRRTPYFCSGCPHNWGTKVPAGALVGAGTGCHGMTLLMDPERVGEGIGITAMGNEGAQWIGMEPFVDEDHLFQNYGDGTLFHSGQLAIQNCIAAGKHMTFKILYNSTVAMTGGQDSLSALSVPALVDMVLAWGVAEVAISTEDPSRYRSVDLPAGVRVHDRRDIVAVQDRLRSVPGVTMLIHDQECAAELRRDRRRGRRPQPTTRVVINERICEGCGDCGDVSNCLSVQPVETAFGRKTRIDQGSCNFDYSCLQGDCPAFMTVEVDPERAAPSVANRFAQVADSDLPDPPATTTDSVRIRLAGIGGTGVVTVAQLIGTAAMLDGWTVHGLDQTGLSQKAGPVVSDVVLSRNDATSHSNLIGIGQADVLLAFDGLVAASDPVIGAARAAAVVASSATTSTGDMVTHPTLAYPTAEIHARLQAATGAIGDTEAAASGHSSADTAGIGGDRTVGVVGAGIGELLDPDIEPADRLALVDAPAIAGTVAGPAQANTVLLGVALQLGHLPVSVGALERAIELNGVSVSANRAALAAGRRWALDRTSFADKAPAAEPVTAVPADRRVVRSVTDAGYPDDLADLVAMLATDLIGYQDRSYAEAFLDAVRAAADTERSVADEPGPLAETVARNLYKLMAYKDEYEVARLMVGPAADAAIAQVGSPGAQQSGARWHLHPPMLKALGLDKKIAVPVTAAPVFRGLAAMKRLRGTWADPFGRTAMRRAERRLAGEYRSTLASLYPRLRRENLAELIRIAALPDQVRGYENLKMRRIAEYEAQIATAVAAFV